jgi:hypothetical protein
MAFVQSGKVVPEWMPWLVRQTYAPFCLPLSLTGREERRPVMKRDEYLRLIAGAFVLIAVILGATVHASWNYFAAFVAINLMQSAFTGWCPMMALLRKFGVQE